MKKERIKEHLQLLYPLEDWKLYEEKLLKKRRKETLLAGAAVLLLFVLCMILSPRAQELTEGNRIRRNKWEEGSKRIQLTAEIEGKKQQIELCAQPRSYTREELENLFYQMLPVLEKRLLGKNNSAQSIREAVCFDDCIEGYPFVLHYESSDRTLISEDGTVAKIASHEEGKEVWISITAVCEAYEKTYCIPLQVMPPIYSAEEIQYQKLVDCVMQAESKDRERESFDLPDSLEGKALQWKEAADYSNMVILFGFICLPLVWKAEEQQLNKALEERNRQLMRTYPDFVTRLALLLGTGMTVRGALCKIAQDEEKKRKRLMQRQQGKRDRPLPRDYLLTELTIFCRALEAGVSEGQACLNLGKRCGLQQYRRTTALLSQNLKRGSKGLLAQLTYETHNAWEDRKAQAKQWGEEAGSKLLLPMVLMLVVVMILIMVPALGSFSL